MTLMDHGATAAVEEIQTPRFANGYLAEGFEVASYFRLLCERLDHAFQFAGPAASTRPRTAARAEHSSALPVLAGAL
jgi:hypothetical protein